MASGGVFMKKLDPKTYRRLKSMAAERGVPVYVVLNEAISAYVASRIAGGAGADVQTQEQLDNAAYAALESDATLQGKWVAIAEGGLLASAGTEKEAVGALRQEYVRSHFKHGIVALVGEGREEREWLAGSLQQE